MCGIAGYAGKGGSGDALHFMTKAIERRGPDDEGYFIDENIGLGFRRLSIIDVNGGHQPISNEKENIWVMLNGEIYGFGALRDELLRLGHEFKTKSDTEIIVHAYEQYGDDCFEHLNGMFAIAIWDIERRRLVLARDRMGKKPLYWTVNNGTLWFASELKALLAAGIVERKIDFISLGTYFRSDAVPTPRSIFQNVQKLEPATAMSWSDGKTEKIWKFWQPSESRHPFTGDVVRDLGGLIDKSVAERLVSDVPLGLFLSGGLDSAVIAESAARQGGHMQAFTIGFDDPSHDESGAAREVARALNLEYHVEMLKADDALAMIDQAVEVLDEPLADASILPTLLLSRFTRQHVTVALSGDGGDELLLGYQHVSMHQLMNRVPRAVQSFLRLGKPLLDAVPAGSGYFSLGFKTQRLARGFDAANPWARDMCWRGAMTGSTLSKLINPEILQTVQVDFAEEQLAERANEASLSNLQKNEEFWRKWSWAYLRTFLMDEVMVKVDRATMWYALEARAPLLDTRVVEFLLNVQTDKKLGAWKGKRLFKELLKNKIPAKVLNKPKHGFAVPVGAWLNGPLSERLNALIDPVRLRDQGLFVPQAVSDLAKEHQGGRIDRRKELWAMFMFQLWYDSWVKIGL